MAKKKQEATTGKENNYKIISHFFRTKQKKNSNSTPESIGFSVIVGFTMH